MQSIRLKPFAHLKLAASVRGPMRARAHGVCAAPGEDGEPKPLEGFWLPRTGVNIPADLSEAFELPPELESLEMSDMVLEVEEEQPKKALRRTVTPTGTRDIGAAASAIILGGGEMTGPMTRRRAAAAVPVGGSLKMVDVTLNAFIKAGINSMSVLTQHNSWGLNHHVAQYAPPRLVRPCDAGFIEVLAAQQTPENSDWATGSADAIRKQLHYLFSEESRGREPADYIVVSGTSSVHSLDVGSLLKAHSSSGAAITVATHLVDYPTALTKGVAGVEPGTNAIWGYAAKPSLADLHAFRCVTPLVGTHKDSVYLPEYLASMGVYVFNRNVLLDLLADEAAAATMTSLGTHLMPAVVDRGLDVRSYQHTGVWRDTSTLRGYLATNLALAGDNALSALIYDVQPAVAAATGTTLPPAKMVGSVSLDDSLVDDGAVLVDCQITSSVLGRCTYVGAGSVVQGSLLLGSTDPCDVASRSAAEAAGERVFGIGSGCVLTGCIVDRNATVGDGCVIDNAAGVEEADHSAAGYVISEGIVVVLEGAVIAPGTVI